MTMDGEQWPEQDDIYENGDTIGRNEDSGGRDPVPSSRGKVGKDRAALDTGHPGPALPSFHPPSDRYQTIRWHTNRAQGQRRPSHLALFKHTTLGLVVLCILLIASVIGLSFAYYRLTGMDAKIDNLATEINILKKELGWFKYVSKSIYHISSTEPSDCNNECFDLFVLNYEDLEKMNGTTFYLYSPGMNGGGCDMAFSWNCTKYYPKRS
ncbi:uncharacterized protein LOC114448028 isoform X2 [Parambassis ranga]|uniref:Uncharacterized protein LOC114448028 isoform X2 n=1 Tax=Parambassis ranga TaxID=210632 RepID=A0A6P7JU46_9TELE|nr:uncharacterized protein LOC114448028 isoform X2 [Parambassis ranga]